MGVDYCRQGCVITPAPCHLSHYVASSQYVRASLLVDTTVTRTHPGVILVRKNALRLLCSTLNNALAHLPDVELKVVTTDSAGPHISDRLDVTAVDRGHFPNQEVIFTRRIFGSSISLGLLRRLPALVRWADVVHLTATYSFPTIPTILVCRYLRTPLVWSLRGAILDDES